MKTFFIPAAVLLTAATCRTTPPKMQSFEYQPRTRSITVTTVPLLVKEARNLYPFLKPAFAKGGVLDGKEVYAFSPSTITVVQGDTIRLKLINPEDDLHSFVLPDFAVTLPGGTATDTTYIANRVGVFTILCSVPSHLPMMSGQLVVLPAATMADVRTITEFRPRPRGP